MCMSPFKKLFKKSNNVSINGHILRNRLFSFGKKFVIGFYIFAIFLNLCAPLFVSYAQTNQNTQTPEQISVQVRAKAETFFRKATLSAETSLSYRSDQADKNELNIVLKYLKDNQQVLLKEYDNEFAASKNYSAALEKLNKKFVSDTFGSYYGSKLNIKANNAEALKEFSGYMSSLIIKSKSWWSGQTQFSVAELDSNTSSAAASQSSQLTPQQISVKLRAMNTELIDRAIAETNVLLSERTSNEDNSDLTLALDYLQKNKSVLLAAYDTAFNKSSNYSDAQTAIINKIRDDLYSGLTPYAGNKIGIKKSDNGVTLQNLNSAFFDLSTKTGSLFGGAKDLSESELGQAVQETNNKANQRSAELLEPCQGGPSGIFCWSIWWIFEKIVGAVALIAGLSITIFEYAVNSAILNMKDKFDLGSGEALKNGLANQHLVFVIWKIVRDIVNILVFFSAVYIGIRRILGDEGDFVKNVVRVLMFAFLVNFSYPISKFLIDISNASSLFIFNYIVEVSAGSASLAKIILSTLGFGLLSKIFGGGSVDLTGDLTSSSPWTAQVLVLILSLIMLVVFAFLAIMLFARMLILIFCVIFSPLMFASGFLGIVSKWQKEWADNFFGNIIFAPLMMLGLYMIIGLMTANNISGGGVAKIGAVTASGDVSGIARLLMAIVGFVLVYYLAKMTSGSIGNAVGGLAMKGLGTAGMFVGGGLIAGSAIKGAGALMGRIASSKRVQDASKSENSVFRKFAANAFIKSTDKVQNMKAGIGKFARSSTYKEDVKKAGFDALDKNRDLLKGMSREDRRMIEEQSRNVKTVADQKRLAKTLNSIKREEDTGAQQDLIKMTTQNFKDDSLQQFVKDDKKLRNTDYTRGAMDKVASVATNMTGGMLDKQAGDVLVNSAAKIRALKAQRKASLDAVIEKANAPSSRT